MRTHLPLTMMKIVSSCVGNKERSGFVLRIKEYVRVESIEEAYDLITQNKQNRIIGGMLWLKMQDIMIPKAIDLSACHLDVIEEKEDEIRIGAMVSLRDLETSAILNEIYCGIIPKSVKDIVGVQFRNLATIGGSIYSRFGFSDILTALLALPVDVVLYHGGRIALKDYVNMPYERDVLTHIIIKKENGKACYLSERKSATDFPVLAIAASIIDNKLSLSIGARPKKAQLITMPYGKNLDLEALYQQILETMEFDSNIRGSKEYRVHLMKVLVKRALNTLEEDVVC